MQKLFENWRKYVNEAETDAEYDPDDPFADGGELDTTDWDNFKANWPQIKAEYEGHYLRFKKKFIKTVLVDRRESLEKIFKKDTEENKVSLPVTFLVQELTNFLKNVKLTLMLTYKGGKPSPSRDPDRNYQGGPAFYDWKTGIHFEDFFNKWYRAPLEGAGWSYESVVYHELGHAMEHGLFLALKKASKIKSKIEDPSIFDISVSETRRYLRSMLGIQPWDDEWKIFAKKSKPGEQWQSDKGLSVQKYKQLLTIAPGLKDKFSYDHFHKELPWEFYASLKAFTVQLERELIPLDIQVFCARRNRGHGWRERENYRNLLAEWYEFLPTKLKKIIDDAHDRATQGRSRAPARVQRGWWIAEVGDLAGNIYGMAEFLQVLDCNKDPNYIVQVLRSLY